MSDELHAPPTCVDPSPLHKRRGAHPRAGREALSKGNSVAFVGSEPVAAGDFDHPVNGRKGEERAAVCSFGTAVRPVKSASAESGCAAEVD